MKKRASIENEKNEEENEYRKWGKWSKMMRYNDKERLMRHLTS